MSCNVIDDSQILRAYATCGINSHFRHVTYDTNPKCKSNNCKEAYLYLTKDGNELLKHCCIHNEYILNSSSEKYVVLHNIRLKDDIKNTEENIGKKIINRNKTIYKESGFKKIILKAVEDGIIAWRRIGFEFDNIIDEKVILKSFNRYLKVVKNIDKPKKYRNIKLIEKELLFDEDKNFTDWLKEEGLQGYGMTLRIENEQ